MAVRTGTACGMALWAAVSGPVAASDQVALLPSGESARLFEVIDDRSGEIPVLRMRFVAPWIAPSADFDAIGGDMLVLCQSQAVPRIADMDSEAVRIVISLSQEETEFGVSNPEITQFFEIYSLSDGRCIWEPF